jgi:hypothetical protein
MPTLTEERVEDIVAGWRTGIGQIDGRDNPAGLLYPSGEYAAQEITMGGWGTRTVCCSACTASLTRHCC